MIRRLTTWSVIFVLLACPQLCRANLASCCAGHADAARSCCDRCAAERTAANHELPAPVNSGKPCSACCLCKGAVLSPVVVDLAPDAESVADVSVAGIAHEPSLLNELLRVSLELDGSCGLGARIALASLLC